MVRHWNESTFAERAYSGVEIPISGRENFAMTLFIDAKVNLLRIQRESHNGLTGRTIG